MRLDEVVDGFGGSVRYPGSVPRRDLVLPAADGASGRVDFGWARVVDEIDGELSDEL
jgi:hypothetical protein